ncbi:MAG: DUF2922 domain-containing protein [bacterium]
MVQRQTLRLTWRNTAGRSYSLTINNPKDNITVEEIEAFMDLAIAKNIIQSSGGDLVAKQDAHMIDLTDQDFYTPMV